MSGILFQKYSKNIPLMEYFWNIIPIIPLTKQSCIFGVL